MARQRHGADEGDRARDHNWWNTAIHHYERYLTKNPNDIGVRLRLASTLREAGELTAAIQVLRDAAKSRPEKSRIHFSLAEVLDEAGFEAEAELALRQALLLTGGAPLSPRLQSQKATINPPPPPNDGRSAQILIDIRRDGQGLGETLVSLQGQTLTNWRATVWGDPNDKVFIDLVSTDARIAIAGEEPPYKAGSGPILRVPSGAVLRPECLSWLFWALEDGTAAVYCDHEERGRGGISSLVLQSGPHLLDLQTNPRPPEVVLFREFPEGCLAGDQDTRVLLSEAFDRGSVRHVPLILAGVSASVDPVLLEDASGTNVEEKARILVVIPTRDEFKALDAMLTSLFSQASHGDEIDVVVVDNGSCNPATIEGLEQWRGRGVEVLRLDEPFNWSRLNNIACEGRTQPVVVFANNDMEVLSKGWDDEVRRLLALDGVGVLGARLLYPNDRVQHAGIIMGALNGEPLHEGLRVAEDQRGPLDRWVRRRPATAVTGAFMAVRRTVFDQVGGFDAENFAVSCNDVDFCLRVGAAGWTVLYSPELVLRHHESLSRGHANTEAKQKRVAAEMERLLARWSGYARLDPTRNPQWKGRGIRLFAETRALTTREAMDWVVATGSRAAVQRETPTLA